VSATAYRVTGAYVTVKTETADGMRIIGLYAGAPVPADASDEWVKHHLSSGLIEEVASPAPAAEAAEEKTPARRTAHKAE